MDHLAVMEKNLDFIQKILDGRKTIESRWYKTKKAPWGKITKKDVVYFKNAGGLVNIKATVSSVIEFGDLTFPEIKKVLDKYWKELGISKEELPDFYERFGNKRYCILIFLEDSEKVTPFKINKEGFGAMTSWICTEDIKKLKV